MAEGGERGPDPRAVEAVAAAPAEPSADPRSETRPLARSENRPDQRPDLRLDGTFKRLWFGSPLYALVLAGKAPRAFVAVPPDPWPGDPLRGNAMLAGEFIAAGLAGAIDGDPWDGALKAGSAGGADPAWLAELHGFAWLRDVKEVGGEEPARFAAAMVEGWIERFGRYTPLPWRADVVGERLAAWISHSAMIFRGADRSFIDKFFRSLGQQRRHLMRVVPGLLDGACLLHAIKALIYAQLALTERDGPLNAALDLFVREIQRQILADGGHCERSPALQIEVLRDLVDVRGALVAAHKEVPSAVQSAIDRMAPMVRFFRHSDGGLALYNDSDEGDAAAIDLLLARSAATGKPLTHAPHIGFHRLVAGSTLVIADTGAPAKRGLDEHAHAGTLSFEMSIGKDRMIVNCGTFPGADAQWRRALRATAAHSTAVIDDTNSSEIKPDGSMGARVERCVATRNDADGAFWLDASHDGYWRGFGVMHKRRLYLAAGGQDLRGEDNFVNEQGKKVKGAGRGFTIRFHLHPSVRVSLVQNGASALLQMPNGQGWRFRCAGAALQLSDSVYFGQPGQTKRNEQIVVMGTLQPDGARVKWAITKA